MINTLLRLHMLLALMLASLVKTRLNVSVLSWKIVGRNGIQVQTGNLKVTVMCSA